MNRFNYLNEIEKVIKEKINFFSMEESFNKKISEIDDWDSLTNIEIITSIEKRFNIKFTIIDIINIQKVADLVRFVNEKKNIYR